MTGIGFARGDLVTVTQSPVGSYLALGTIGYVDVVDPTDQDYPLGVILPGWLGPVWFTPGQLRHAPGVHTGDPVIVHAAASRYDGREGRIAAPDDGGFAVALAGEAGLVHFEQAELTLRPARRSAGGGLS